jgi:hypothetical protein
MSKKINKSTHENKETQNIANLHKKNIHSSDAVNVLFGFILFFIIFVVFIPYVLFKKKFYFILEGYLPNLDLIANILTWASIGDSLDIWNHLYPPIPHTIFGFISQTLINYMALLGLTYVVISEGVRKHSIKSGWAKAFIMLLMTYLLPSQIISYIMDKLYDYHTSTVMLNYNISKKTGRDIISIFGIILTILIIISEGFILRNYEKPLNKFAKHVMNIPKLIT